MCLRESPALFTSPVPSLASGLMAPRTLLAMTTLSRLTPAVLSALPSIFSDCPAEYTSAVSEEVDAGLQRGAHQIVGLLLIEYADVVEPPAEGHGAQTELRDPEPGLAELTVVHGDASSADADHSRLCPRWGRSMRRPRPHPRPTAVAENETAVRRV